MNVKTKGPIASPISACVEVHEDFDHCRQSTFEIASQFSGAALHILYIDNELRGLIPAPTEDELAALEASLQAEGCREALIAWDDVLIDGHNRYHICHRLGIPFRVDSRTFTGVTEAKLWMVRNQRSRRNLTDYQRSVYALMEKDIISEMAKANQGSRTDLSDNIPKNLSVSIDTRNEVAAIAGVSESPIAKIEKIEANAVPAIRAVANVGEILIHAASKLAALPEAEQREIAVGGKEAIVEAAPAPSDLAQRCAKLEQERDLLQRELDELKQESGELAHEFEVALAELQAFRRIIEADDKLAAACAELKQSKEMVAVLESRLSTFVNEKNEHIRRIKSFQRQVKALEQKLSLQADSSVP